MKTKVNAKTFLAITVFNVLAVSIMVIMGIAFTGNSSYGAAAKISQKDAELIKVYVKILNKVGNNKKVYPAIEKNLGITQSALNNYMNKSASLGDAVFLKIIEKNAVNQTEVENFVNKYSANKNMIGQLNDNSFNVKNVIKEMNNVVKLKVVNEVYRTATGVSVDHELSLAVNTPNNSHNLTVKNYMTNQTGNVYQNHEIINQTQNTNKNIQQINSNQQQLEQINNTQRQINQVNNTQRQLQQINNTQQQLQQINNTQRQMMGR